MRRKGRERYCKNLERQIDHSWRVLTNLSDAYIARALAYERRIEMQERMLRDASR